MISKIVFPSLCLHCQEWIPGKRTHFCSVCKHLLHLLEPDLRCLTCFVPLEGGTYCARCRERPPPFRRLGAAFDYTGPAATLIHHLKSGQAPYLARDLAAFMVVQLTRFRWPWPDLLVPVPLSFTHFLKRGYNQSRLLADEMGKLMNLPVWDPLRKSSAYLPQMGQDREQRESLSSDCFSWKHFQPMENKTLLLVDDVVTTGTTLRHCTRLLQEASSKAIYALTACLA